MEAEQETGARPTVAQLEPRRRRRRRRRRPPVGRQLEEAAQRRLPAIGTVESKNDRLLFPFFFKLFLVGGVGGRGSFLG